MGFTQLFCVWSHHNIHPSAKVCNPAHRMYSGPECMLQLKGRFGMGLLSVMSHRVMVFKAEPLILKEILTFDILNLFYCNVSKSSMAPYWHWSITGWDHFAESAEGTWALWSPYSDSITARCVAQVSLQQAWHPSQRHYSMIWKRRNMHNIKTLLSF